MLGTRWCNFQPPYTPALSDYCFWAPYKYSATTTTTTTTTTTDPERHTAQRHRQTDGRTDGQTTLTV